MSYSIRLKGLMLICFGLGSIILFRAASIQLFKHEKLAHMAKRQFESRSFIRPKRGQIFDRNGELLAMNQEVFSLAADPSKIKNKTFVARLISHLIHQPFRQVQKKLAETRGFVWLKRHLSELELKSLKRSLLDLEGVEGVWFVKESDRVYPHGKLASHVLGDVNIDSEGIEGVELWKDAELRGNLHPVFAIKDARGRPTFIDASLAPKSQDGKPIWLTLDSILQYELEQVLKFWVDKTNSKAGVVIVMDSETGDLLSLANEPSFLPHSKVKDPNKRRNRAITDGYEPGSTLKALLLASALSSGWKLSDRIWGELGSTSVQSHRITEAEAHEKFEWLSLKEMIQVSSNVVAAKLALKLGASRLEHTLKMTGFASRSKLGFPGEIAGYLPPAKKWSPLTLATIGFGQGLLVTPLQMIRAYAVLANGGYLVQPRLLLNEPFQSPVRVFPREVVKNVNRALLSVTEEGTGKSASLEGFQVAGKTGTAQIIDPETRRYSKDRYNSSFIGFPVGVDQKLVILTILSEPKNGYYSNSTAAPFFRDVLERVVRHRHLAPALSEPMLSLRTPSISVDPSYEIKKVEGKEAWVMPSLKGLTAREVVSLMKGRSFDLRLKGKGLVASQSPEAGKEVAEGGTLRLKLSEP